MLVVDDDESILQLVSVVLSRAKYDVDTAVNGSDALEKMNARLYDVVVLDLMMPEVSGFDVLERLRAVAHESRAVVIMSAASSNVLARAAGLHVFAALQKPFEVADLVKAVDACARRAGAPGGNMIVA